MRTLKFRIKPQYMKENPDGIPSIFSKKGSHEFYLYDEKVIDQFTGACDVNGEEIYENDRVMYSEKIGSFDSDGEKYELIECIIKFKDFGFFACWGHNNCNKEGLRHSKQMKIIKG